MALKLGPAKRKEIVIRSNKKSPIEALRAVLRPAIAFIKEHENLGQVKWQLVVTVREKI